MTRYTLSQTLPRPARAPSLPRIARPVALNRARGMARALARPALVAAMAVMSIALWIASPLAWLWIVSRVTAFSHPGLGPYALLFAGILLTSLALGRVLADADRAYQRVARIPNKRLHRSWLRANGQQKLERPNTGPLGVVMAVSVIACLTALAAFVVVSGHPFEPLPVLGPR